MKIDTTQYDQRIAEAKKALNDAVAERQSFIDSPENNVFASMDDAEATLEDRLRSKAHDDCEGSYNCGMDSYEQEFIVDGKHYLATLDCEYNRHDKTYYYLEESSFSVKEIS